MAVAATPANLKNVEHLKRQRVKEEHRALEAAKATAARIEGLTFTKTARASEDGHLYGSVSAQDVVEFLERNQVTVEKRRVQLDEPIKAVGDYQVPVRLHGDVTATLAISVAAE
jgi:large subunit ribosomal protein L9